MRAIENSSSTQRSRHCERWLQYGREQCLALVSHPHWVSTTAMVADIFTKPLDLQAFLKFRNILLNFGRARGI